MEKMNINVEKIENDKNIALVQLNGRFDAQHSEKVEESLLKLIEEGHLHFIIDMQDIVYLGSSGIRVLLSVNNKLTKMDGTLKLLRMSETGKKILQTMEILNKFMLFESRDKAIESF